MGSRLVTYAYPENEILDFSDPREAQTIVGDFFEGVLRKSVVRSEHPFVPYPHLETSIEVRGGASGAPVFDEGGRVVGVCCRGWDFRGTEQEGDNLSVIVPIGEMMPIEIELLLLPAGSWEEEQIPPGRRGQPLTFAELAAYGHMSFVL